MPSNAKSQLHIAYTKAFKQVLIIADPDEEERKRENKFAAATVWNEAYFPPLSPPIRIAAGMIHRPPTRVRATPTEVTRPISANGGKVAVSNAPKPMMVVRLD